MEDDEGRLFTRSWTTEGKLGISLVLARVDGAVRVITAKREALVAVNGCRINVETPEDFAALVLRLSLERPISLAFERLPRTDAAALREYERRASELLDGKAAYNASILRARGVGGEEDVAAALLLLRKSANLGVVRAQLQLARLYSTGRGGVKRDEDEAVRWYCQAAKLGSADAFYELGLLYDKHEQLWCFFKAAKLGHAKAQDLVSELAEPLLLDEDPPFDFWHASDPPVEDPPDHHDPPRVKEEEEEEEDFATF
ncbi:hypothetical protein CTAYLR_005807 [Chrysophaeum taylorii]|uniref:Uncharacterized protein n=1 Tax=Chrysophaeum taylorii TaxID=2483200 RepID=A0AAD7XQU1_9STRA|nr:hypothetical protein CTAYLR_005807 [Chrysophaeum taylorii]